MQIDIVLKSTLYSGNLGMIARACKNFSINNIKLVNPLCTITKESTKYAANARDLLFKMSIHENLEMALKDYNLVVGTTARRGYRRDQITLSPNEFINKFKNSNLKVAFIFGPEDKGLDNETIFLCNYLINIPTSDDHPSLNLSHAITIIAYEYFKAKDFDNKIPKVKNDLPDFEKTNGFYKHLEKLLNEIGYFKTNNHLKMMSSLRRIGTKARLTNNDITILRGVFRQLSWFNKKGKD